MLGGLRRFVWDGEQLLDPLQPATAFGRQGAARAQDILHGLPAGGALLRLVWQKPGYGA
jgi:hypothetical protein